MTYRALLIGYGNLSRQDDGVAWHVINGVRLRWGQPALAPSADGWEELGGTCDSLFLQQLAPELAATLQQYDLVVFVDASVQEAEPVRVERVSPGYALAAISHHMTPGSLLALTQQLYGRAPEGLLVSVQGHNFDFGDELSAATALAVPEAVERIVTTIRAQGL